MPKYDELSISKIMEFFKDDPRVLVYFPDNLPKGRLPDRQYFFNIVNTVYPGYVGQLINQAHANRFKPVSDQEEQDMLKISEEWAEKLLSQPFISCKYQFTPNTV